MYKPTPCREALLCIMSSRVYTVFCTLTHWLICWILERLVLFLMYDWPIECRDDQIHISYFDIMTQLVLHHKQIVRLSQNNQHWRKQFMIGQQVTQRPPLRPTIDKETQCASINQRLWFYQPVLPSFEHWAWKNTRLLPTPIFYPINAYLWSAIMKYIYCILIFYIAKNNIVR